MQYINKYSLIICCMRIKDDSCPDWKQTHFCFSGFVTGVRDLASYFNDDSFVSVGIL